MSENLIKDILTDAIRYWERRRIAYNLVLAAITLAVIALAWPESGYILSMNVGMNLLFLFILAVLANVVYCSAYIVDFVLQYSDYRPVWLQFRWGLFAFGLLFASALTLYISLSMFSFIA